MQYPRLLPHAAALTLLTLSTALPATAAPAKQAAPGSVGRVTAALTQQPANPSPSTSATFGFSTSGATATACSLDGSAYAPCSSPLTYGALRGGVHTFTARAAGKTGSTTTSYRWTVDTTAPSQPLRLSALAGNQRVTLSWSAASDVDSAVTGYVVFRNGARVGVTSTPSYTDTAVSNGTQYTYTVAAYDAAGNTSTVSAAAATTPSTLTPLGVPGNWTLKFDDEFSGTSVDYAKWQPNWLAWNNTAITPPDNSNDLNCMDPAQVTESGGVLNLTAVTRACLANNGKTYGYASGVVNSLKTYNFTYGYVEARVYVAATAAGTPVNFPAVWANGTGTWPASGELDVMEVLKDCGPGLGFHFHSSLGAFGGCASLTVPSGWHTFGANWQSGVVTYYYDGQPVGQVTSGVTGAPMYLVLNNSVDPTWGGPTLTPADVRVDYVRVWQ